MQTPPAVMEIIINDEILGFHLAEVYKLWSKFHDISGTGYALAAVTALIVA
jgi:hypothetical protein